jgi:hypothetical protein
VNKLSYRDQEYIENRLMDAGPAAEACGRLRQVGRADLAEEVMWASRHYVDRLRRVRNKLLDRPVDEFSGINSAPDDPVHVQEVIDHIAHLEPEQVDAITAALIQWKKAAGEWENWYIRGPGEATS